MEVNDQLGMPDCRFVLLTAAPGAGKSTFMAQLAKDHEDWPRYFIRRDQRAINCLARQWAAVALGPAGCPVRDHESSGLT